MKFQMGDRVRKTKGSEWEGIIVGTYSTELTPEGYAVESEAHAGSVQIYPATALEIAQAENAPELDELQTPTVKHSLTVEPVAYAVFAGNGNVICFSTQRDHPSLAGLEKEGKAVVALGPIAQTAPQREQDERPTDGMLDAMRRSGLSIDGDNAYKRDLIDTIIGTLMLGKQGNSPPPAGHWAEQFWEMARAEGEMQERLAAQGGER